jgi:hypothetical protein
MTQGRASLLWPIFSEIIMFIEFVTVESEKILGACFECFVMSSSLPAVEEQQRQKAESKGHCLLTLQELVEVDLALERSWPKNSIFPRARTWLPCLFVEVWRSRIYRENSLDGDVHSKCFVTLEPPKLDPDRESIATHELSSFETSITQCWIR